MAFFPFYPSGHIEDTMPRHGSREASLREDKKARPSVYSYLMVDANLGIKFKPFTA